MKKKLKRYYLSLGIILTVASAIITLSLTFALPAYAAVNITQASGGNTISADTTGGAWTTLGSIAIAEGSAGDIATGNFVLTIPSGFEFNTASVPDVAVTGTTPELAVNTPAVITATTITVTVTASSSTETDNVLTIGGITPIQVRPTSGTPLASGNINMTSGTIAGVDGATNFGTLTEVHGTATQFVIIDPADGTVDAAIAVTVELQDQYGNTVTTGADKDKDVTLNADGSATGDGLVDIVDGMGTINISDQVPETVNLDLTDSQATGYTVTSTQDVIFAHGTIDHYSVSNINSPQIAGIPFTVIIQAQDVYNNDITTGADAAETINISFGLVDAGASPILDATASGTTMINITMTVAQDGQSITFTGDTSGKTGTSNIFDVSPPFTPPSYDYLLTHVDSHGTVTETITLESFDSKCHLTLEKGITAKTLKGTPLYYVRMTKTNIPPPTPDNSSIIGLVYEFYPSGATFDPSATLNITYDPSNLPEGVSEDNLFIVYYDDTSAEWVKLDSTVDTVTNIVTAQVSHFTNFTIIASTRPASFSATDLTISPTTVDVGQSVIIQVMITNSGDLAGDYQVMLIVDDVNIATREITLAGGASQIVSFTIEKDIPGSYTVNIGDQSGTFTVNALALPTSKPEPTSEPAYTEVPETSPTPLSEPASVPASEPSSTLVPDLASKSTVSWWLIGGIIGACVIIGLLILFVTMRVRHK